MYRAARIFTGRRRISCAGCKKARTWHFSILRPVLIVGLTIGGAMDLIPPARRSMPRCCASRQGTGLSRRSGAGVAGRRCRSLGAAIAWSGEAEAARNQAFNVTNGDVFTWENIWPAIADALDMKPARPCRVAGKGISKLDRAMGRTAAQAQSDCAGSGSFVGLSFSMRL